MSLNIGDLTVAELVLDGSILFRGAELIDCRMLIGNRCEPAVVSGDVWVVRVTHEHTLKVAYFIQPIQLVKAADGLDEILAGRNPSEVHHIRKAHARLADAERSCKPSSIELLDAMASAIDSPDMPKHYSQLVSGKMRKILEENGLSEVNDKRLIKVFSILAYRTTVDTPIAEKEANFKRLLGLLDMFCPQSEKQIVGALSNLGRICFEQRRFIEAEEHYRRASDLNGDCYVNERLGLCLCELGRYKEACDLFKPFSKLYFEMLREEYNDTREWCETEHYARFDC